MFWKEKGSVNDRRDSRIKCGEISKHIPHIRTVDGDALCDSEEDVTAELALCRQIDNHHGSSGSEVVDSLLVSSRAGSGDDSGVGSCTTSGLTDILHQVLGFPEVDPLLSTKTENEVTLLGAGI